MADKIINELKKVCETLLFMDDYKGNQAVGNGINEIKKLRKAISSTRPICEVPELVDKAMKDIFKGVEMLWPGDNGKEMTALDYICNGHTILKKIKDKYEA